MVCMLLKHANNLEQQGSIRPRKQVTSKGGRASNALPPLLRKYITSLKLYFHLKSSYDFAFYSMFYLYIDIDICMYVCLLV